MDKDDKKPREWWIKEAFTGEESGTRYPSYVGNENNAKYERGFIHVIEKSAYDEIARKLEAAEDEIDRLKKWLPQEMKPSEKKLSAEVNRLLNECNRLQNLLDKARLEINYANKRAENK